MKEDKSDGHYESDCSYYISAGKPVVHCVDKSGRRVSYICREGYKSFNLHKLIEEMNQAKGNMTP